MASLFDELHIGSMTARNRAVRSATAESLATADGRPTPELVELYERLARGGVGTIITGYAYVSADGKPSEGALGAHDDSLVPDLRRMVDAVHAQGARIVLQLVYGGSKSKLAVDDPRRISPDEERTSDAGLPDDAPRPNVSILGPSAVEHPRTHLVPIEAACDALSEVADLFGDAAARAKASGFDGVEVHVAHGYLLSQFLSRTFNKRDDVYGGSLRNRARLACECVTSARAAVGSQYPVLAKVNAWDELRDPEGAKGGLGAEESAQAAALLVHAGASAIDVSGDWHAAGALLEKGEPFFSEFGARLASELPVPVIVTGGWRSLEVVNAHLENDGIAAVGMSRPFICEPDLMARWAAGDTRPSVCKACGYCQKHVGIPCVLAS